MMRAYIEGIGLCGPGLDGWAPSAPILAGTAPYVPAPAVIPPCTLLPANERRRAPKTVRLALAAAAEAFAAAGRDASATATVFASSGGDGETIHDILTMLATQARELSPTKFHNSVHNAAAGYWSIATGATTASTSLCAHDDSFAAGLLEACAQAAATQDAVALIAYDVPYPAPLFAVRPVGAVFGVALVLAPVPTAAAFARLDLALNPGAGTPSSALPALEELRQSTPSARGVPLLSAIASGVAGEVSLRYLEDMNLHLTVTPRPASGWPQP
jgi:hypothetical protein